MKRFFVTFFIVFTTISYNAYGMFSKPEIKEEDVPSDFRQKSKVLPILIRENYRSVSRNMEKFYELDLEKGKQGKLDPQLLSRLETLIEIFPYDDELQVMYADALFKLEDPLSLKALKKVSQSILSEYSTLRNSIYKRNSLIEVAPLEYFINYYGNHLLEYFGQEKPNRVHLQNMFLLLAMIPKENYEPYLIANPLVSTKAQKRKKKGIADAVETNPAVLLHLRKTFIEHSKFVFDALKTTTHKELFDALFLSLYYRLLINDPCNILENLPKDLYSLFSRMEDIPNSLKMTYAEYLFSVKRSPEEYQLQLDLYKSLLEPEEDPYNCFAHTVKNYFNYGFLLNSHKDRDGALEIAKKLSLLEDSYSSLWYSTLLRICCGVDGHDVLDPIRKISKLSSEDMEKHGILPSWVDLTYYCFLESTGRDEELAHVLEDKLITTLNRALQRRLERDKKQGEIVKAGIEAARTTQQPQTPKAPTPQKAQNTMQKPSEPASSFDPFDPYQKPEGNNADQPLPKEKTKTKGVPNQGMAEPKVSVKSIKQQQNQTETGPKFYNIQDIIGKDNGNAIKIFYKLFTRNQKKNKNGFSNDVKISLCELQTLFEALEQVFDPGQGKGSHTKVRYDFQAIGNDAIPIVEILPGDKEIKPYMVEKLRVNFYRMKIVPNDQEIIDELKKQYPDI